ncbi:MAG: PcfJ domain-containing protein [Clostridium sp.]
MYMCQGYSESYSEDEVDEVLIHMKDGFSDELKEYAIESAFKSSRYLFVEKKENKYIGYCTYCGHEYEVGKLKHNGVIHCKNCKTECKTKLTYYGRKSLVDKVCFVYYEKSVIDHEVIAASGIYAERDYSGDYRSVETYISRQAVYVFKPGKAEMVIKHCNYFSGIKWKRTRSIYSFNNNSLANYDYSISYKSVEEAVKGTKFQYSMWEEYVGRDMLGFFELYTKYPNIESLTKVGLKRLINDKLTNANMMGCINWRGKTIYKMLRIGKKDLKSIRQSKVNVSPLFLKLYQNQLRENSNLEPLEIKEIERIVKDVFGYKKLEEILECCNLKKAYKYLIKQEKNKMSNYTSLISTWLDYIGDCKKLKMDLNKESVLFPKNVIVAHQNTIKQIKYKEDKVLNKKIEERLEDLNKLYYFENENLFIRPAISSLELVEEGSVLHHCVAGYSKNYAEGKTNILVIRSKDKPNEPFFTIEIKDNEIKQVHGKHNNNPSGEIAEFVEQFKAEKLESKNKKIRLTA